MDAKFLLTKACIYHEVNYDELISKSQKLKYVKAKMFFCIFMMKHENLTFQFLGNILNRDHSSIVSLRNKFYQNLHLYDNDFKEFEKYMLNIIQKPLYKPIFTKNDVFDEIKTALDNQAEMIFKRLVSAKGKTINETLLKSLKLL